MKIRPLALSDIDTLINLASQSGVGVTTLPNNKERLSSKLQRAVDSLHLPNYEDPLYFFCLEDQQKLLGLCAIEGNIGSKETWYNYRLSKVVHSSKISGQYGLFTTLNLSNDMTGSSELCSLFLLPEARNGLNSKLLSKCRYLFIAEFSERFSQTIIAEMRGINNDQGISPFWQSLGQRFFNMDFSAADFLLGSGDRAFVAELMPKYPIYSHMLSKEAQAVIGMPHQHTAPALHLLEAEGFRKNGYVDIFDAGPVVSCEQDDIRAINESRILPVIHCDKAQPVHSAGDALLVSNQSFADFVCILVSINQLKANALQLSAEQQASLHLSKPLVRVCTVKPEVKL